VTRHLLVWTCLVGLFVIALGTRIQNPDMAETRLWLTFWRRYLVAVGLAAAAVWFARRRR
jgi:heme/copper-type cytochrome/quinol oxidase subunit 1